MRRIPRVGQLKSLDRAPDALGDVDGRDIRRDGGQQRELFAAIAIQTVWPRGARQAAGHCLQDLVARYVSGEVIDRLEMIDVGQEQRVALAVTRDASAAAQITVTIPCRPASQRRRRCVATNRVDDSVAR